MAITAGTQFDHYEIIAPLGANLLPLDVRRASVIASFGVASFINAFHGRKLALGQAAPITD